ncbi:AAA family ATPase [Flavobacterium sp. ST-75]|uniref:AAA family ATPase n=1 Tax=Flavobacterium rhizophilum TaxID=3163296 RepID=A0ABW8YA80_9FLAO
MKPLVWINEIEFNDGTKIPLSKNDIIVFVGPNNSGKSLSLKEIEKTTSHLNYETNKVIKKVTFSKEGSEEELILYIEKDSIKGNEGQLLGYQFSLNNNNIKYYWSNVLSLGLQDLKSYFLNLLSTERRLAAANPPRAIALTSEPPSHPIHILQKNDELEEVFSNYFKQAFGTDLIVHRNAGNQVPLYVGKKPIPEQGKDRVSTSYLKELEKLDLLHLQGDGMRSFVGVLLNAFISTYSILLIDEPEAFLHPPQARLLGKMISKNMSSERQTFLSTHSESFLKGLLDTDSKNLKVVRLQREGNINKVSLLDNTDINTIWSDSLLRHSNILDGLFHSKVVICESDSDSRFFSSILSSQFEDTNQISPDILFINVGGKHRIPVAIKALKNLNVPISVVSDFDVLNNIHPLKAIYEDLDGNWNEIKSDWELVKSEIERKRPEFLTMEAKEEIENILEGITDRIFPKEKVREIQQVFKKASPWTEAKAVGKAFIPSGNATQAFERLQLKFKDKGLFIVEVGELEGFVRSVGNHGPKWINEVLIKDQKNDPELEIARQFIKQII